MLNSFWQKTEKPHSLQYFMQYASGVNLNPKSTVTQARPSSKNNKGGKWHSCAIVNLEIFMLNASAEIDSTTFCYWKQKLVPYLYVLEDNRAGETTVKVQLWCIQHIYIYIYMSRFRILYWSCETGIANSHFCDFVGIQIILISCFIAQFLLFDHSDHITFFVLYDKWMRYNKINISNMKFEKSQCI